MVRRAKGLSIGKLAMATKITTIADLKPDPRNANLGTPRGHSIIERSLRQRGAGRSGLAANDGTIIAGNQTLQEVAALGIPIKPVHTNGEEWVVVIRDDVEPGSEQAVLLGLEDNRSTQVGLNFSPPVLADLSMSFGLSGLWTDDELKDTLSDLPVPGSAVEDVEQQMDRAEELREKWGCAGGQIWQLGRHIIACLDCRDPDSIQKVMNGQTANMVWADPPYGISVVAANGYVGDGEANDIPFGGVKNKGNVGGGEGIKASPGFYPIQMRNKGFGSVGGAKPFGQEKVRGTVGASNLIDVGKYAPVIGDETTETATKAAALYLAIFPQATHFWWGANYYADMLPPSSCWIVWDKENTGNFADAELAWCSDKSAVRIFRHMWNGLMKASERGVRRVHPTQKPVALAKWAFEKYGTESDVIVDPFLGSGMSLMAAEQSGNRRVIGFELSPEYIAINLQRFVDFTGQQPQLLQGT